MTRAALAAGLALSVLATPALAHGASSGVQGLFAGAVHSLTTPAQALCLISAGFLAAGHLRTGKFERVIGPFFLAFLAGMAFSQAGVEVDVTLFTVATLSAATAALFPGRAPVFAAVLCGAAGLLLGIASIPDDGARAARIVTMAGSVLGVAVIMLYIAGVTDAIQERFPAPWIGIGFRVIAAWLAAISLVMLALAVAPPR